MKLKEFKKLKFKPLFDNVAFEWNKPGDCILKSGIILPTLTNIDGGGEGRLGHRFICKALCVGPDAKSIKPGDYFMIHEYDKTDQGTEWRDDDVMFCEEKTIIAIVPKSMYGTFIKAPEITDEMYKDVENL